MANLPNNGLSKAKSVWKPARLSDLTYTGTITIYLGPDAWSAAKYYCQIIPHDLLSNMTGIGDSYEGEGSAKQPPLVAGLSVLNDESRLHKITWAESTTRYVYLEKKGKVSAACVRNIVSVIKSQAPKAEIFEDGNSLRELVDIMQQAGVLDSQPLSSAKLKEMGANEKADLLLARYDGALSLDIASSNFYHYTNGIWQPITDNELSRELAQLHREIEAPYSAGTIATVVDTLRLSVQIKDLPSRHLIGFQNGVFNINEGLFATHSKTDWLTHSLDVDYADASADENLQKHAPNFSRWLNCVAVGDTKQERVLAALFMVLANRYDWQLFLEITGPGGSGKSVFAEVCTMLAGADNTISATIDAIENPRERSALVGYALIVLPDQPRYMGDGAGLKAITGGDAVMVDPKHKKLYSIRIPAVVLAINNNPMMFSDRSGGISRRRVIFNFSKTVPVEERDGRLIEKIALELPVIIRHLLKHFVSPESAKKLLHAQQRSSESLEIKRDSDTLIDFCSYFTVSDEEDGLYVGNINIIPMSPKIYLFHAYLTYMTGMGHQRPLSLTAFGRAMPYAIGEFDGTYLKKRVQRGYRTNLHLKDEATTDWLYSAAADA